MDNENLSNQQSLEIITRMISTAKGNINQGVFHMLLWSWVLIIISLSHFLLAQFQLFQHPEMAWLLTIPTFIVSFFVGLKKGKSAMVRTHLDYLFMWVWLAFAATLVLLFIFIYGNWELINPVILALAGFATFLSGALIKFKPMMYGAVAFWLWSLVAFFVGPHYGTLVMAIGIFTGYLLPGYLLKHKSNESATT